ncbi:hypothetical protein QE152_g8057 [Popillia japonica]|uniref:Uncharacterized protein n=1 Tax=Popillia japonica TaxID=7064 RepID=A0AAW1M5X2_POPJA
MGSPRLQKSLASLIGFGGDSVNMLGFYEDDIVVDNDTFFTKIFVAPNGTMNIDAVIGQELLRHVEMKSSIDNNTISYKPKKTKTTNVTMKIITSEDIPIYHQPRRLPFTEPEIVDNQVQVGIIESCTSEYASQVVVVKKKDGFHRLCIDYR